MRNVAIGAFRGAVVNLQFAVFEKARERLPLIQHIAHSGTGRTLRQHLRRPSRSGLPRATVRRHIIEYPWLSLVGIV